MWCTAIRPWLQLVRIRQLELFHKSIQSVTVFCAYLVLIPKMLGNRIRRLECVLAFRTDDGFLSNVKNETKRCKFLTELLT